jgi:hypothetical protein
MNNKLLKFLCSLTIFFLLSLAIINYADKNYWLFGFDMFLAAFNLWNLTANVDDKEAKP